MAKAAAWYIDGQTVLVPVLYLANANNRLAPDGALVQGTDVSVIAGSDLSNAGTLKATGSLSAIAGNNLSNTGVVQADSRLDLLAGNNLTNSAGGIIAGRDVSLTAVSGDVTNERTVTSHQSALGSATERTDFVDSAARVEAAGSLTINAGQDVNNTGGVLSSGTTTSITATRDVNITAAQAVDSSTRTSNSTHSTTTQNSATVTAGTDLSISAGQDLTATASQLTAGGNVALSATDNLSLSSAADETHSYSKTHKVTSQQDHVAQVGTTVTAGGEADLSAGKDLTLTASQVSSAAAAYVYAGDSLTLQTADNIDSSYYSKTKKGSFGKKSFKMTASDSELAQSSSIVGGTGASIAAVNDVDLHGSTVSTGSGALSVQAGRDVSLTAAQNLISSASAKSKSGGFGLSTTSKMSADSATTVSLTGSTLSGDTTLVQAGRNVKVSASDVVGTQQTVVSAANDISIESADESFSSGHSQSTKKSGLLSSGGIGVTLGSAKNTFTQTTDSTSQKGSMLGSVNGSVDVTAGKNLQVKSSDVVAGTDIRLIGQNVDISQAADQQTTSEKQTSSKSGLTLALSGVVGESINTAVQTAQQASQQSDSRVAALEGVKAGLSGYQAWQGAQALDSGAEAGSFFGISLSLGAQKSSAKQTEAQSVSHGSTLTAADDLSIVATGSGNTASPDGDISIAGATLKAGNDLLLSANRDLSLVAAQNTQKLDATNQSGGGAIGLSLGVGSGGGGLSIFASGNAGKGNEKGTGTTWTETTVDAGNKLSLESGRDTTLQGAQASGQQVVADVGRDLSLTSLQDTDQYNSKQLEVSGGLSFTFGTMTGSASLNISQDKIKSNYDSVQDQTGLYAGSNGFQLNVGDHTQLNGSVISSTADAAKNSLSTATLGWTDIANRADYSAQHQSVGGSTGGQTIKALAANALSLVGGNDSGSASSTTYSAVSDGSLVIRDGTAQQQDVTTLSHDVADAANALSPIFNKEKEQERLQEVQLIGDIGTQSMDIIHTMGEIEASKAAAVELAKTNPDMAGASPDASAKDRAEYVAALQNTAAYQAVMSQYGTGSSLQEAAQAVTAAIQGLAGGNLTQAAVGAAAPYLANEIKAATGTNTVANTMAHALLGAVLASSQGNSAAAGAAGASVGEVIARAMYPGVADADLTESQKQNISALATVAGGLAGALVGGSASSSEAAASAAQNSVNNNQLSVTEALKLQMDERAYRESCSGVSSESCITLKQDIDELKQKGSSVLPDYKTYVGDDSVPGGVLTDSNKPGEIVGCAISANNTCVVSNQIVTTPLGQEYVLTPANDAQVVELQSQEAQTDAQLKKISSQLMANGDFGLSGALLDGYKTISGTDPVTGQPLSAGQRVLSGISSVFSVVGAIAPVLDFGGGVVASPAGKAETVEAPPAWDSSNGLYSTTLPGSTSSTVTNSFNGSVVENLNDFSNGLESGQRSYNGVELNPKLPEPEAGWDYTPKILVSDNPNIQNSHVNGFVAELQLANAVADLPGETVLKYGDAIGRNGSDVISVSQDGSVTLWDSKYRSSSVSVPSSPTFSLVPFTNALNEAATAILESSLSDDVKTKAFQNVAAGNVTTVTSGSGMAKNSVVVRMCSGKPC